MTTQAQTEQARKLYQEYKSDYRFCGFNKAAFWQRVRRLAKQVNSGTNWDAFMYLTYIETREGIDLTFAGEASKSPATIKS